MKKFFFIVFLSVLLHGCATTGGYEKVLNTWIGHDVNDLIQQWGPPSDVYRLPNSNVMYTWWFDGGAVAMPIGNMAYAVQRNCKTTFTADMQGTIQTWRWEGNACKQ